MCETPIAASALSWPLNEKELEKRLFDIELVSRVEFDTDAQAFEHVKSMIFRLRRDLARAVSGV